jgi:hypothetical protein
MPISLVKSTKFPSYKSWIEVGKRSILLVLWVTICLSLIGFIGLMSTSPVLHKGVYMEKQFFALILAMICCALSAKIPLSFFFGIGKVY